MGLFKSVGKVVGAPFKALGLGLGDEQGAYNDQAELQKLLRSEGMNSREGMNHASQYIKDNVLTSGVYGDGGLQSQLGEEGRQLADSGFQLQKGDREAYGQASGDISRLFGQQEQQATQNLARRGLASASSGAAGAAFSGLQGNKNEMLASAQMDIAQKRMVDTQNRLQQNRTMQQNLATQGNRMAGEQYQRTADARSGRISELNALEASKSGVMKDQKAAVKPGLFSTIGQGLQAGIGQLATQAPGMLATGGMPTGMFSGGGASPIQNSTTGLKMDKAGGTTGYSNAYMNQK